MSCLVFSNCVLPFQHCLWIHTCALWTNELCFYIKMCQDELARLCKTVHPMQGSILRCLITSHRANPLDFGSDCFSVLKEMTQSSLTDYRYANSSKHEYITNQEWADSSVKKFWRGAAVSTCEVAVVIS